MMALSLLMAPFGAADFRLALHRRAIKAVLLHKASIHTRSTEKMVRTGSCEKCGPSLGQRDSRASFRWLEILPTIAAKAGSMPFARQKKSSPCMARELNRCLHIKTR
jgi:hypothetical protein